MPLAPDAPDLLRGSHVRFYAGHASARLMPLVAQRVADGRVLRLIRGMLKAGVLADGQRLATEQGTAQGGIVSPLLSNIC